MTKTEQKIRELVPSLQELTFGCEVLMNGDKGLYVNKFMKCHYIHFTDLYICPQIVNESFEDKFEILGHPIQLHHVLQAISLCGKWYIPNLKSTGENGSAILTILKGNMSIGDTRWDLTKDFSNQSEEVQMFISYLLE